MDLQIDGNAMQLNYNSCQLSTIKRSMPVEYFSKKVICRFRILLFNGFADKWEMLCSLITIAVSYQQSKDQCQ